MFLFDHKEATSAALRSIYDADCHLSDTDLLKKMNYQQIAFPLHLPAGPQSKRDFKIKNVLDWLGKSPPSAVENERFMKETESRNHSCRKIENKSEVDLSKLRASNGKADSHGQNLKARPTTQISSKAYESEFPSLSKSTKCNSRNNQEISHPVMCHPKGHTHKSLLSSSGESQFAVCSQNSALSLLSYLSEVQEKISAKLTGKKEIWDPLQQKLQAEQKLQVGKLAELYFFDMISKLSHSQQKKFPVEDWISSYSKELRNEQGSTEDSIDDSAGYDFILDSSILFSEHADKREKCRVEVKGSEYSNPDIFFLSSNELEAMKYENDEYVVVLVANVPCCIDENTSKKPKILGFLDRSQFLPGLEKYSSVMPSAGLCLTAQQYKVELTFPCVLLQWSWLEELQRRNKSSRASASWM